MIRIRRNKGKKILFKLSLVCILLTLVHTIKNREESNFIVLSDSMNVEIISNRKIDNITQIKNTENDEDDFKCTKEVTTKQREIVSTNTSSFTTENKKDEIGTIDSKYSTESTSENITFEITFYTSLNEENGYGGITASGKKLGDTMVLASNVYPFGTIIYLEGFGELEVQDRGGVEFDSENRLDVYIPRQSGESDAEYKKRVIEYGRRSVSGKIL